MTTMNDEYTTTANLLRETARMLLEIACGPNVPAWKMLPMIQLSARLLRRAEEFKSTTEESTS